MQDFKSLKVWEKGHKLTLAIYRLTDEFPDGERFGLVNQMRRSSASIPTNIAEGCGRGSNAELARFCQIAMGSASELQYQLILSHDLGFVAQDQYKQLEVDVIEVKKMLSGFMRRLRQSDN